MPRTATSQHMPDTDKKIVDELIERARAAQAKFEHGADQKRYDTAALAAAWALMEPARNEQLSQLAVASTGLGNVADKIQKNHRKTLGLLRDLKQARTHGIIADDPETNITRIARPIGVVAAVVPSTNPVATPTNNIVNALKCGNAIILSPSPKGAVACQKLLSYIHAEFDKVGLDHDLVQMIPAPSSKAKTQHLMEAADLLVVTGSQDNVRRAYSAGTPAVGVGAGNVTVIVDESADLATAAKKIAASKCFDNATSCSSENALVVVDAVFDRFMTQLQNVGGQLLAGKDAETLRSALFGSGKLNPALLATDIDKMADIAGLSENIKEQTKFFMLMGTGIGPEFPESGEKLSLVLTIYRATDFAEAKNTAARILAFQGAGHSIGLHSTISERALELGGEIPACRVIVNQAHCFATGGAFDNGMPFSLSMGCGSWGGNSIDDNLNYRHFMNITKVVRTIPERKPALGEIFDRYWAVAGK